MEQYDNFEKFVTNVIEEADKKSYIRYNKKLTEIYKVPNNVYDMTMSVILKGWPFFLECTTLFELKSAAFATSLIGVTTIPVGVRLIKDLNDFGGIAAIKILYQNKTLFMSIKDMGEKYKNEFKSHINEYKYIDNITDEASDYLLEKVISN